MPPDPYAGKWYGASHRLYPVTILRRLALPLILQGGPEVLQTYKVALFWPNWYFTASEVVALR